MYKYLDLLIKLIGFLLFAYGLWHIFGSSILFIFRERMRLKKILKSMRTAKIPGTKNALISHLERMLNTGFQRDLKKSGEFFLGGTFALFTLSFLLLINTGGLMAAFLISVSLSLIPYLFLWVKLRSVRIESSYEGDSLVTALNNNYKQYYMNMVEAVDKTSCSPSVGVFSRKNLFRLSLTLKSYRTEEELDEAIKQFVYTYNTEWAVLLGMNIKIAVFNGTLVCESMDDIIKELKEVREQVEANKRYNSEAFSMIRYILIPLYLLTIYVAIDIFGFSFKKFLMYQFVNPLGLRFVILTFASIAICFIVLILAKKPKYDS